MTTPAPMSATAPALDPVTFYERQRAALLAAGTAGYVDPHFTDPRTGPDDAHGDDTPPPDTQRIGGQPAPADDDDDNAGPPQYTIRPTGELDSHAAMLLGRNPGLSFDDALRHARTHLGMTAPEPVQDAPDDNTASAPQDGGHPPVHPAYLASAAEAARLFPEATQPGGEFNKRIEALDRMLKQSGDPLHTHLNKPLLLAHLVAAELRPPVQQAAPAAPLPQPTRQAPARMTAPLSGGTPGTATSQSPLDRQINDIRTPEQYRQLVTQLTGRSRK